MQKLNHFIIKTFNLKPEETQIFTLLFLHSFFLGLFIAFYFVPANAVFIKNYGSQDLPIAYMVAGIVGYLSTYVYSHLQSKVDSRYLFLGALLFMFLITITERFCLSFVNVKYLSFFVFIWAWPFISLVGIEAGGLSLRYLNLIQVKRLFGLFNMGGVLASIIGYLTIPVITHFIGHSYNLLFIGIVGLIASIAVLLLIYKRFPEKPEHETIKKSAPSNIHFFSLIKERYFLLIFTSATLSMVIIYMSDFGFLSSIKVQKEIFDSQESVSRFMALVYGGLKVGELIISYSSSRLLSKYGVKLGLTILPLATTVFITIASLIGLFWGVMSIAFLVIMTINKSSERILRRGLDDPAFNILYQPLPNSDKLAIQSKVGVVQQFSIGIAGFILFLANLLLITKNEFQLQYFSLIFLPVLVGWVFVSRNLYLSYRGKIKQILVDISRDKKSDTSKYLFGSEVLTKKIKKNNEQVVNLSVTILSETNPRLLEPYAVSLLEHNDLTIKKAILRNIDPTWRQRISDPVSKLLVTAENHEIKRLAEFAKYCLDFTNVNNLKLTDISKLLQSDKIEDKLLAVKFLFKNVLPGDEALVLKLLEDKDKTIKSAAITLAGKRKAQVLTNKLIELLNSAEYYHISSNVLLEVGDRILPDLDSFFKEKVSPVVLLRIVEIFARIGSTNAKSLLVTHLSYPNRDVQVAVMWALYFCRYQADSKEMLAIRQKFEETVENILWILAAINDIEEERNTLKLYQALDLEKENSFEALFQVLSFMYEPRIINLIRKNIIGKDTIFALEIIDNFISQDIKQYIVPLFDDISVNQRLKKLHHLFPQKKMSLDARLKSIITREYNKLDTWTVTKAIELLGKIHKSHKPTKGSKSSRLMDYTDIELWTNERINETLDRIRKTEMPDEIFLALFHNDELIYTTAAKIIYEENPLKCADYLNNMTANKQKLMKALTNDLQLLPEKVQLVKRHPLFFNVPEKLLVKLARLARSKEVTKNDKVFLEFDNKIDDIFILLKGALVYQPGNENETYFFKDDIIIKGLNIEPNAEFLTAKKDSTIFFINRYDYFNLLLSETEIINHIFEEIQTDVESDVEK